MRYLYFITTLIFWLIIVSFWAARSWLSVSDDATHHNPMTIYSLNDVAEHNQQEDCWMAIYGQVYDLTTYLPQHPTALPLILPSCGTEASHAYETKNRSRPHSDVADELLKNYQIGVLNH
jgi:cytochrome b involved in lipid metabolism